MGGWKEVKGVNLCDGPCCYGYHEVVEHPPLLSRVVYCKKNSMRAMLLRPTMNEGPDKDNKIYKTIYWQKKWLSVLMKFIRRMMADLETVDESERK